MEFHKLDDKHIEVLAGDLKRGVWDFRTNEISREGESPVKLEKNTKSLEVRLKKQVSKMDTVSELPASNLVGMALGMMLGPWGGMAASNVVGMAVGKNDLLCIGCQLLDGRKFIAWMSKSVLETWEKSCNLQARDLKKEEAEKEGP